jgi:hypothetical protein
MPVVVEIAAPSVKMGDAARLCLMEIQKAIGRPIHTSRAINQAGKLRCITFRSSHCSARYRTSTARAPIEQQTTHLGQMGANLAQVWASLVCPISDEHCAGSDGWRDLFRVSRTAGER